MRQLWIEIPKSKLDAKVVLIRSFQPNEFEKQIKRDNVLNFIDYKIKKVSKAEGFHKILITQELFTYIKDKLDFICKNFSSTHTLFICNLYNKADEIYAQLQEMLDYSQDLTNFKKVTIENLQTNAKYISQYLYYNVTYIYNNYRYDELEPEFYD